MKLIYWRRFTGIAALLTVSWLSAVAAAADLTQARPGDGNHLNAVLREKQKPNESLPLENRLESVEESEALQGEKIKFFLARLQVDESEILKQDEIAGITSRYEGREVTLQDIYQAVQEINSLYGQKANYIARALLQPQTITGGVVRITLAESHIGAIRFEKDLSKEESSYILHRMTFRSGGLLQLDQLEKDIIRFNKTNTAQLQAALVKGEQFGTTDVVVRAEKQAHQQISLYSDNGGSESSGEYRGGLNWSANHLFTVGDTLSLNTIFSKGNTGGGITYEMPLDYSGTRLGVSYSKNQSDVISGVFQSLQVTGDSSDLSVTINRPLEITATSKVNQYMEVHEKKADTYLLGDKLIAYTLRSIVAGWSSQRNDSRGLVYSRIDVTRGYSLDTSAGSSGSRSFFTKGNLSWVNRLPIDDNHAWLFRFSGQWNFQPSRNLPSTEAFSLGGFSTVRGYKESAISGDRGYFVSSEYHFPLGKVEGILFFDHGGAFSYDVDSILNNRDCYMTSIGVGVLANLSRNAAVQVFWGRPIAGGKYAKSGRFHFLVQQFL